MKTLPIEIVEQIVLYIPKITDKRQFTQTCKKYNAITNPLIKKQELTIKIEHFEYTAKRCVKKFTLELCDDSYFNMIPHSYLNPKNNIIVRALTTYGQVELLKTALNNGCKLFTSNDKTDEYGHYNNNSSAHAIVSGNIEMLKFVISHGCEYNGTTFDLAARHDNFDMMKFLKQYGCEMGDWAATSAVINSNMEMFEWLIENGYKLVPELCFYAACKGYLEIIKILRNKYNCPWDSQTTLWAAEYGHLDTLKWCIENGCDFKPVECYKTAIRAQQRNTRQINTQHITAWITNNYSQYF